MFKIFLFFDLNKVMKGEWFLYRFKEEVKRKRKQKIEKKEKERKD